MASEAPSRLAAEGPGDVLAPALVAGHRHANRPVHRGGGLLVVWGAAAVIANRCCGIPGCQYAERRPMASRPIPPAPRWLTVGSRLLALGALVGGICVAGAGALR